jgi:hypothetical protein
VDGAGDLNLVTVSRVDERLLLLDLGLVLDVQNDAGFCRGSPTIVR